MRKSALVLTGIVLLSLLNQASAQSLSGSRQSMTRQNQIAKDYDYTFIKHPSTVTKFVNSGYLVPVKETGIMDLHAVSYPYARPAVNSFLQQLSAQYHAACGEKLVVTSLTRPISRQPVNASSNSVHPTGMAVDLRIPSKSSCRSWLEKSLLSLEASNVLDVTRERRPPHYHVAVFTEAYEQSPLSQQSIMYTVRSGDSLWKIAQRMGTTVSQLKTANGLNSDNLQPGQKLQVITVGSKNDFVAATEVQHKVQRGDTLWRISRQFKTSVERLRIDNGLASDTLSIGQILLVRMNSNTL